jgi:hypothetical protein
MKQHHPDRPGGDSDRAAEINRAYTLLRRRLGEPVRVPMPVPVRRRRRLGFRQAGWLLALVFVGASVALERQDARRAITYAAPFLPLQSADAQSADQREIVASQFSTFDEPVQPEIVQRAVAQAVAFHSARDLAGATTYSSECQKSFQREPNVSWFDTCAAFDEAMLTLGGNSDGGPGPFNEPSVITRELSAARQLSGDSLGADAHLHQIRSQVDMEILPMLDSAAALRP